MSATGKDPVPRTAMAFRFLEPPTAPVPPRPAEPMGDAEFLEHLGLIYGEWKVGEVGRQLQVRREAGLAGLRHVLEEIRDRRYGLAIDLQRRLEELDRPLVLAQPVGDDPRRQQRHHARHVRVQRSTLRQGRAM